MVPFFLILSFSPTSHIIAYNDNVTASNWNVFNVLGVSCPSHCELKLGRRLRV